MTKKIVYLLEALHKPNNLMRILCQKINWLAENTEYELYVVLTEQTRKPLCYELSSKVQVINMDVNYDELDKFTFAKRWFYHMKKQQVYRKKLGDWLVALKPQITVSLIQHDIPFLHKIKDGSHKLGEIHFKRDSGLLFSYSFFSEKINRWVTCCKQLCMLYWIKKLDSFVTDTDGSRHEWEKIVSDVCFIPNPLKEYPELSEVQDIKKVMAIGDYMPGLGLDQLIMIWERLAPKYPDWRLHLYGDGELAVFKEMIKNKHLSRSVQCYSRPKDLYQLYSQYTLLVQIYNYDKFGRHLMEAMAYGLPCIAFNVPFGPDELIEDEKNGFLVSPGHTTDFTSKLGLLMHDEELRLKMRQQAHISVRPYLLEVVMPRWVELFDKLSR